MAQLCMLLVVCCVVENSSPARRERRANSSRGETSDSPAICTDWILVALYSLGVENFYFRSVFLLPDLLRRHFHSPNKGNQLASGTNRLFFIDCRFSPFRILWFGSSLTCNIFFDWWTMCSVYTVYPILSKMIMFSVEWGNKKNRKLDCRRGMLGRCVCSCGLCSGECCGRRDSVYILLLRNRSSLESGSSRV